jgi:hypothetical protein
MVPKKDWSRALRETLPVSLAIAVGLAAQEHFAQQQHISFEYVRSFLTHFPVMLLMFSIFSRFGYFGAKDWATPDALVWWRTITFCFSGLLLLDFLFPLPWHGGWESSAFVLGALFAFLLVAGLVMEFMEASRE